jgi:hypothetical protein
MSYVDRYLLAITDARKALPQRQPSASVPEYDWQRLRFILSRRYDRAEFGVTVLDIGEEDPTRYYKYMNERIAELTGRNMESIYTLGYRIIEEVWLPEEVPMLVTAHERFFDHLKQLDPAERVQHTLVACNSIRRPDGSVIRMITVGRLLPNVHGNGSTALLGYHYLTAPITPPFVVTSFDGLAGTADVMPLMPRCLRQRLHLPKSGCASISSKDAPPRTSATSCRCRSAPWRTTACPSVVSWGFETRKTSLQCSPAFTVSRPTPPDQPPPECFLSIRAITRSR